MTTKILILGDSSSADIGAGGSCYPRLLHDVLAERGAFEIHNHAVPGFTSADASRYYQETLDDEHFDNIIIYLGNNEGATAPHKGVYKRRWWPRNFRSDDEPPVLRPILSPPKFRFDPSPKQPSIAVTPREFRANMKAIIRCAGRRGARCTLLNPVANKSFPAGTGAPNALWFCRLDGFGHRPELQPIDQSSQRLAAAVHDFVVGDLDRAAKEFAELARNDDLVGFIARHNSLCVEFRHHPTVAPTTLTALSALLHQRPIFDGLIAHNLAAGYRCLGDDAQCEIWHRHSYDWDIFLYRVKKAYRTAISAFDGYLHTTVIDLAEVLAPDHFVDYCHPTRQGHERIALLLAAEFKAKARRDSATTTGTYQIALPSPNAFFRPKDTILAYYSMEHDFGAPAVEAAWGRLRQGNQIEIDQSDLLHRCLSNFKVVNSSHPLFQPEAVRDDWLPLPNEFLSFPEFYICRMMAAFRQAWKHHRLDERRELAVLLQSMTFDDAAYRKMALASTSIAIPQVLPQLSLERVFASVDTALNNCDLYRINLAHRLTTVLTWYTREAFRYGTHSRRSMLFPAWALERIAESLLGATVLAIVADDRAAVPRIETAAGRLHKLYNVHRHFADTWPGFVDMSDNHSQWSAAYREALYNLRPPDNTSGSELGGT